MDIIGTALSAAQTLTDALQCFELLEKLSVYGYESELVDLQRTVEAITAVLRDAETKQELPQQAQVYIETLKDAVFEADDLVDEFVTLVHQQLLVDTDGTLCEKVSRFFSGSNPICVSYWMSRGIKDIKKKLDAIAYNNQFSFHIDPEPIRKRRPETCSYVNEVEIIGREDDLGSITSTLLASNDQCDVSFLSIVGIGGLGKTALAQLVYNHPTVSDAFSLKMWICVSDQDQKELDVKNILVKILASITNENPNFGSTMDQVQSKLREQLVGKKYLLVLDDVWTENRDHWCNLARYLSGENRGSWVVVTTRSQKTATITGGLMYKLSGLSDENSWHLFERTAFASEQSNPTNELVRIGKKIVDGCARVPLAIRVTGTLLYGQEKSKWLSVQKIGLTNIRVKDNSIMSILKLSFHHLEAPLKYCFRYCALFPKDYVIEKDLLINLWLAQGYIVPLDKFQSIEDAGEEYFLILLKRCFFQDIKKDEFGDIVSCKIHDLMHDIAQNVSGKEIYALDTISGDLDKSARHLSIFTLTGYEKLLSFGKTHIRSLLSFHYADDFLLVETLARSFRRLRVLDLSDNNVKRVPESIGELLHLRYIDLSLNFHVKVLPNSITNLCNLQTLKLRGCENLKELPKDLSRLAKLRVLDIVGCDELTWMPKGMGRLTCLHTLQGGYRLGGGGRCKSWKQWLDGLEDLKALINLKGELGISMWWPKNAKNDVKEDSLREGLYLRSMEHLYHLMLFYGVEQDSGRMQDGDMTMKVMEDLQPHSNLKRLSIWGYHGVKMPSWATATLLPRLVKLHLEDCTEMVYLPGLGNMCHLKFLHLEGLPKLEYIEEEGSTVLGSTAEKVSFFPSLEQLCLASLPKLNGWRRLGVCMEASSNACNNPHLQQQRCLTHLKELNIRKCPKLTCRLLCPMLETLTLRNFCERMQIFSTKTDDLVCNLVPRLRKVTVSKVAWLNSMPLESLHCLQTLAIHEDDEMVDLPDWIQYLSFLETLKVQVCRNLKAMPNWMPKLTSLRKLNVSYCSYSLKNRCQKDPPGEDWPYIQHIPYIDTR